MTFKELDVGSLFFYPRRIRPGTKFMSLHKKVDEEHEFNLATCVKVKGAPNSRVIEVNPI